MSSSGSGPRLDQARSYISAANDYGGFGPSFVNGAGGLVMAMFTIVIGLGESFANLITSPTDAFADLSVLTLRALFGGPARFTQSAWNSAAVALGQDPWMDLGPFVVFVAMLAVVMTLGLAVWALDASDFDTPTGLDLPFIGLDDGGDLDDEN